LCRIKEASKVIYGQTAISCSWWWCTLLDVVKYCFCIWFRYEGGSMTVIPSPFLLEPRAHWRQCTGNRRGVIQPARHTTHFVSLLEFCKALGCLVYVVVILVRMVNKCQSAERFLATLSITHSNPEDPQTHRHAILVFWTR